MPIKKHSHGYILRPFATSIRQHFHFYCHLLIMVKKHTVNAHNLLKRSFVRPKGTTFAVQTIKRKSKGKKIVGLCEEVETKFNLKEKGNDYEKVI